MLEEAAEGVFFGSLELVFDGLVEEGVFSAWSDPVLELGGVLLALVAGEMPP